MRLNYGNSRISIGGNRSGITLPSLSIWPGCTLRVRAAGHLRARSKRLLPIDSKLTAACETEIETGESEMSMIEELLFTGAIKPNRGENVPSGRAQAPEIPSDNVK
jgi:hypothetical protein